MLNHRERLQKELAVRNRFYNDYINALKRSKEGMESQDGLINLQTSTSSLNEQPTIRSLNTDSNFFDYDVEAQRFLSELVVNDPSGEKIERIVGYLSSIDGNFTRLMVFNWNALRKDLMDNFSGKTLPDENVITEFLYAKLTELAKRQVSTNVPFDDNTYVTAPQSLNSTRPSSPLSVNSQVVNNFVNNLPVANNNNLFLIGSRIINIFRHRIVFCIGFIAGL